MWTRLRKLASPPVFEGDEDKSWIASILNTILIIVMVSCVLFSIPALIFTPDPGRVFIELLLAVLAFFMLVLLRRGRVRLSSFLFTLTLWCLVTYGTYAVRVSAAPS